MQPSSLAATALFLVSAICSAQAYELNILHINDHHSHLQTNKLDVKLDGSALELRLAVSRQLRPRSRN